MANIPELQEAILKALDAVVTQRNNDLKLDKTIIAIIKKNVGLRHGKTIYQVEYSGGTIEAVCQSAEDVYIPKTSVYVLVPQGDFSKEKIIIGRASSIVTDRSASIIAAAVNQFSIVGTNLLSGKDENIKDLQFGLRSFHPASADNKVYHNKGHRYQVLYDFSNSENKIIFDSKRLNMYKEDSTALMIRADFLTNLDIAQRRKAGAKYGLIFNFVFENLNKGYGETNGEILKNISKDITFVEEENEEPKTVFQLGEEFINIFQNNINEWTRENTGLIDQFLEKINVAYLNFQNKNPEKNTDIVTATMLAYQIAVSELKNYDTVNELKKAYNQWKETSIGDLDDKVISYTWTSDDMLGNPMAFNTWNSQYQVFNMDFETLNYLESIIFFKEGFIENEQSEQKWPVSEANNGGGPDIFVKNLQIYAMNPIEIQSGDYALKVEADSGYDIVFDTTANNEEIRLKATLTRKLYEDLSGNTNTSYIWFKEDSSVINAQSSNYHSLGGIGWRKISEGSSSSRFITINSGDNQAYKNNYKCVAIYEPSTDDKAILAYPFVVFNSAAKIDIMLESDLGTHFSYDAGSPTIRVLIKDSDNEDDFEEKGYPISTPYPNYKYKWAIADSANNYILFLDEVFEKDDSISESAMLSSTRQNQLNKIEKFDYYNNLSISTEDPWRATRIKYPVSISSTGFTVTCYVQKIKDAYADEIEYIDVGSASLEFLNQADSITSDYRVQIVNGDQVFQYNEYGITPAADTKKNPLEILPLQTKLFTPSGVEVSGSNYQVEWIFPIENTLIKLKDAKFITNPATNLLQLVKGHEVNFDIAEIYDPSAYANQITCHISFGGKDYYKDTNFYFGKQGSNGTNGTDVIAKIEYVGSINDDLSILNREPLTLYLQTKDVNVTNKMFNVDKTWWDETVNPFNITSNGINRGLQLLLYQKNMQITPTLCTWNIAGNPKEGTNHISKYFELQDLKQNLINNSDEEKIITTNEIIFKDDFNNKKILLIQNLRAKAEIKDQNDNQIYYAFYSLPIIQYEKSNTNEENLIEDVANLLSINRISIDKHFYLNEIIYNADGRNPIYNHNQGLKLINIPDSIKRIIFTAKGGSADTENTACIKLLNNKDDQDSNSLSKIILKRNEENNLLWDIYNIIENEEKFISTINDPMVYVLPDDIYDGSKTNNRIEAELYKVWKDENEEEINQKIATVFAPINMTLNTFGLASLNAWDGNTVTIDEAEGYVMAPQIGAGEKDKYNRFTGILMGKTETYTGYSERSPEKHEVLKESEKETGLFGYSHGLQSIFLDAKTGNATFGLPDGNVLVEEGEGEKRELVPSNTGDNYTEGRIELRPGDISKIGGWRLGRTSLYYVTKFEYGKEKKPGEDGYEEEEIHYYANGLGEVEGPYRGDYVPKPKTGEIEWDGENSPGDYNSGYYNKYHVKDIPHKSSGILLQAGENPYISIKGKPLNKDEVKEMNKINNSLDNSDNLLDSEKLYEESDSYLKEGDSLEIQLDPSAPSLFSIFRHNGSDRYEQKIQESGNNLPIKYHKNTRTFLAGINGKGEFVANSISNVTTTLPAFITNANDSTNYPETSYTTNFAVNTIPAFNDRKANPTHIGFKMDVGNNTLGQLFISALGITPNPIEDQSWKINDYNSIEKDRHSIDTNIREDSNGESFLIKDPTLRISGGRIVVNKSNDINPYGEYIRPIALHGKSISLFGYPTDYDTQELRSKVLFSNNHLILETEENTSKMQLSLGDRSGSSNTFIHLKGYDDTNIGNTNTENSTNKWNGSYVNIATDLHKNIGIFNEFSKRIACIDEDESENKENLIELWRYGSDRYINIGGKFINKIDIYPGFYIKNNNSYQFIGQEINPYYKIEKENKNYYVSKDMKDKVSDNNISNNDFSYYKITKDNNDYYILVSEFKINIYKNNEYEILDENTNIQESDSESYYYYFPKEETSNNIENDYLFIKKARITPENIYYKGKTNNQNYFYYYQIDSNSSAYYKYTNTANGNITSFIDQKIYDDNNRYPYIKLTSTKEFRENLSDDNSSNDDNNSNSNSNNNSTNESIPSNIYCYKNDVQIFGYKIKEAEEESDKKEKLWVEKFIIDSGTLFEKENNEYKEITNSSDIRLYWDIWLKLETNNVTIEEKNKIKNVYVKNYWNDSKYIQHIEYVQLEKISSTKVSYRLSNDLSNKTIYEQSEDTEFCCIINSENDPTYYNITNIKIDDTLYYKDKQNHYIYDINWGITYYKKESDKNIYFAFEEIFSDTEYDRNFKPVSTNGIYYRTSRRTSTWKMAPNSSTLTTLNNLGWTTDKYYLIMDGKNNSVYKKLNSSDLNNIISASSTWYFIDNEWKTNVEKYKKIRNENNRDEYIIVSENDKLDEEWVKGINNDKHYSTNELKWQVFKASIPTKTEYYTSGKIEAKVGTTVDTYTTINISDEQVSLNNLKTRPVEIITPNSGFLLQTNTGELSFDPTKNNKPEQYFTLFTAGKEVTEVQKIDVNKKIEPVAQNIKAKFVTTFEQENESSNSEYGLFLMNNSFALRGSNFGEVSADDKIWIIANNMGKNNAHHLTNPQILLRAGGRIQNVLVGQNPNENAKAQTELILNSSDTAWNVLMSSKTRDTDLFNYPIFAVRSRGGDIGIYPEYYRNELLGNYSNYRENFIVNMNLSVANGLAVQDAYKGVLEYQSSMTSTRTSNPDDKQYHYIGIDSAYSIRTQNYVFARRFMGDGTWIDNTTDLSMGPHGSVSTETGQVSTLIPGGTVTVTTTIPKLGVSEEGRVNKFGEEEGYTASDSFSITLDEDIATQTWVRKNFATAQALKDVKDRLNDLINAYNGHTHTYSKPKEKYDDNIPTGIRDNNHDVNTL